MNSEYTIYRDWNETLDVDYEIIHVSNTIIVISDIFWYSNLFCPRLVNNPIIYLSKDFLVLILTGYACIHRIVKKVLH